MRPISRALHPVPTHWVLLLLLSVVLSALSVVASVRMGGGRGLETSLPFFLFWWHGWVAVAQWLNDRRRPPVSRLPPWCVIDATHWFRRAANSAALIANCPTPPPSPSHDPPTSYRPLLRPLFLWCWWWVGGGCRGRTTATNRVPTAPSRFFFHFILTGFYVTGDGKKTDLWERTTTNSFFKRRSCTCTEPVPSRTESGYARWL